MGSANITPLQSVEIVQVLKNEYQDYYLQHSNNNEEHPRINDDELKEKIFAKYQSTCMKFQTPELSTGLVPTATTPMTTPNATSHAINGFKKAIQKNSNGTKSMEARPRTTSRLRSFDEAPKQHKKHKEKAITESNEEMDSWDSVKGQPACLLCAMVFTSPEKLATHTKYSTIHASNLQRLENSKFAKTKIASPSKSTLGASSSSFSSSSPIATEDKTPYRVLYTGSKFFWRSKHNIDFHIYHHTKPSVLEIIGYDSSTQTELPRLYLDEHLVSNSISKDEIVTRLQANKESHTKYLSVLEITPKAQQKTPKFKSLESNDLSFTSINELSQQDQQQSQQQGQQHHQHEQEERVNSHNTPEEIDLLLYEEEKRLVIATRLVSKLQYQKAKPGDASATTPTRTGSPRLTQYGLSFIDPDLQAAVLSDKPDEINPVVIPRRRHSTQAEISESFRSLNTMQMELSEITAKAEKMSHLIRQSIDLFTHHHFAAPSKPSQYTSPRIKSQLPLDKQTLEDLKKKEIRERWRYAIHKVVLRNALGQTVEMLKEKGRVGEGKVH